MGWDNRWGTPEDLFATPESVATAADQTGFLVAPLSGSDVIGNSPIPHHPPVRIVNDVAGPRIIVAGLADTADIHQVAGAFVEVDGIRSGNGAPDDAPVHFPDGRDMGMAVESDKGALDLERGPGVFVIVNVGEGLRAIRRGMDEHHGVRFEEKRER